MSFLLYSRRPVYLEELEDMTFFLPQRCYFGKTSPFQIFEKCCKIFQTLQEESNNLIDNAMSLQCDVFALLQDSRTNVSAIGAFSFSFLLELLKSKIQLKIDIIHMSRWTLRLWSNEILIYFLGVTKPCTMTMISFHRFQEIYMFTVFFNYLEYGY